MSCSTDQTDYNQGTTVRIRARLTSEGQLIDGSSVSLKVRRPDKSEQVLPVIHAGQGEYYRDVVVDQAGQWHYQWSSSVPGAVEESTFIVRRSAFA